MAEYFTVLIPGDIDPMDRGEHYEDPLDKALRKAGRLGKVVGGGTAMTLGNGGEVEGCHIEVEAKDRTRALEVFRRVLTETGAPRNTAVYLNDPETLLLTVDRHGEVKTARRQPPPPPHLWIAGEVVAYQLTTGDLVLLHVCEADRHPYVRVLSWVGKKVPGEEKIRELLQMKDLRWRVRGFLYLVGWKPLFMRVGIPHRREEPLDASRVVHTGIVVKPKQARGRQPWLSFASWPEFDQLLCKVFDLVPVTPEERLSHDFGLMGYHLAVWDSPGPVTKGEAKELFYARLRRDFDRTVFDATPALKEFAKELRRAFADTERYPNGPPWRSSFRASEGIMIVSAYDDFVDEVRAEAVRLCRKYGLTCYDPWLEKVFSPPRAALTAAR